jgi:hypothetical protein
MGLLSFLFGRRSAPKKLMPESEFLVHVTDQGVTCERPDGTNEQVTWDDLQTVSVVTTDEGPMLPDVFWVLEGTSKSSGCAIPQGATGERELLDRLQKLQDFNNEALCSAMSCTDNKKFICWKRAGGPR